MNKALQETFTILLKNTNDYTHIVDKGLQGNLKVFDENIEKAVGTVSTMNNNLVESVEDLADIIEELKHNLNVVNGQNTQRR